MKSDLLAGASNLPVIETPAKPKPGPKVMVCIPSGRTWEARSATAIVGMATFSGMHGVSVGVSNLEGSMISKQRNDLVKVALEHKMDYVMFIDNDMVFPPDAMLRLLSHEKDIVGATYNKRVPPYETLGRLIGERPKPGETGLRQADMMPGGMMLIKTSVFEKMGWPWYFETYQWPGQNGIEALKNYLRDSFSGIPDEEMLKTLDNSELGKWLNGIHKHESTKDWQYFSEDLNFCRKAIKNGLGIWCDLALTYEMVHLGTQTVTCKPPTEEPVVVAAQM